MAKLVECVPNFSVSKEKDEKVFQGLVDTANSIPGCFVFDIQSDGNHNRCVFTLLGSPEAMAEAAFRLAKQATQTIDMTKHTGQHPRMGATDVIPFIPTMDTTVQECVELSRQVAKRLWDELGLPEGYGFELTDIRYQHSGRYFVAEVRTASQYLGDISGYEAQIAELNRQLAEQQAALEAKTAQVDAAVSSMEAAYEEGVESNG